MEPELENRIPQEGLLEGREVGIKQNCVFKAVMENEKTIKKK